MLVAIAPILLAALGPAAQEVAFQAPLDAYTQDDGSFRGSATAAHALATTAAFAWTLKAGGETTETEALGGAVDWIVEHLETVAETEPARLVQGEALSTAMLADLARVDKEPPVPAVAALYLQRLLLLQGDDGLWPVAGMAADDERTFEAAGWAAWVLRNAARPYNGAPQDAPLWPAYLKAKARLASTKGSPMAMAFSLYFDAIDTAERTEVQHDRFAAACELLANRQLADEKAAPQLIFVMTCTAFQLGGRRSWKSWVEGPLTASLQRQIRTGPRRGYWPRSSDSRGEVWDTAFHQLNQMVYYRYSSHGFVQ